jgi:hypothetical protein
MIMRRWCLCCFDDDDDDDDDDDKCNNDNCDGDMKMMWR